MRFSNGGRIVGAETAEQSVNKGNDYKKGDNLSWRKNQLKSLKLFSVTHISL